MRNAARSSAWPALHLSLTFHVAPRSPPCTFFYNCILQGAIDFAELPTHKLNFQQTFRCNPAYHIAAHHAAFSTGAFCTVQLVLRRCGSGVGGAERKAARSSAWQALHLSLTFSKLLVFKIINLPSFQLPNNLLPSTTTTITPAINADSLTWQLRESMQIFGWSCFAFKTLFHSGIVNWDGVYRLFVTP